MKWARHPRTRIVLVFLTGLVAIATLVARLTRISRDGRQNVATWSKTQPQDNRPPTTSSPELTHPGRSTPTLPSPDATTGNQASPTSLPALIIPVAGVRPEQLRDTFTESRSEGRVHDAIDIPAPQGTAVLAAADGPIVKLFQSDRGGTTIYQLSTDQKYVYYYAHLDRYAEGLVEDHFAKQGETIAYVGDTGNAGPGNYHLHFSIAEVSNPKDFWHGTNINPYPLLRK